MRHRLVCVDKRVRIKASGPHCPHAHASAHVHDSIGVAKVPSTDPSQVVDHVMILKVKPAVSGECNHLDLSFVREVEFIAVLKNLEPKIMRVHCYPTFYVCGTDLSEIFAHLITRCL